MSQIPTHAVSISTYSLASHWTPGCSWCYTICVNVCKWFPAPNFEDTTHLWMYVNVTQHYYTVLWEDRLEWHHINVNVNVI